MVDSPLPIIESWVPAAVVDAAVRLHAELTEENSGERLAVLSRLISDPRMMLVWQELYKTKRDDKHETTEESLYPARVTNLSWAKEHRRQARDLREQGGEQNEAAAKLLEAEAAIEEGLGDFPRDPRWSEQDRAAQLFLNQACRSAINIKPEYLADIQAKVAKLRKIAASLREQAVVLKSLGMKREARTLDEIAADCEDEARISEPNLETDDPWIITRERGDPKLRTYVVSLSIPTLTIFGTPLYGTLARVANVVFGLDTVKPEKVREWLR
jgi:hypothetical protein